jgi:hypothetical protein
MKKWYPGKYLGRRLDSTSSMDSSTTSSGTGQQQGHTSLDDDGKWYPGKYLGRKKNDSSSSSPSGSGSASHSSGRPMSTSSRTGAGAGPGEDDHHQLICIGCRYGETPGIQARGILKNLYKEYRSNNPSVPLLPPARLYSLSYGSLYGEGDKSERCLRRVDGQSAHTAGYLEILNKSDYATAIRVCNGGSESLREHCRPSYFTGAPPSLSLCLSLSLSLQYSLSNVSSLSSNPPHLSLKLLCFIATLTPSSRPPP